MNFSLVPNLKECKITNETDNIIYILIREKHVPKKRASLIVSSIVSAVSSVRRLRSASTTDKTKGSQVMPLNNTPSIFEMKNRLEQIAISPDSLKKRTSLIERNKPYGSDSPITTSKLSIMEEDDFEGGTAIASAGCIPSLEDKEESPKLQKTMVAYGYRPPTRYTDLEAFTMTLLNPEITSKSDLSPSLTDLGAKSFSDGIKFAAQCFNQKLPQSPYIDRKHRSQKVVITDENPEILAIYSPFEEETKTQYYSKILNNMVLDDEKNRPNQFDIYSPSKAFPISMQEAGMSKTGTGETNGWSSETPIKAFRMSLRSSRLMSTSSHDSSKLDSNSNNSSIAIFPLNESEYTEHWVMVPPNYNTYRVCLDVKKGRSTEILRVFYSAPSLKEYRELEFKNLQESFKLDSIIKGLSFVKGELSWLKFDCKPIVGDFLGSWNQESYIDIVRQVNNFADE